MKERGILFSAPMVRALLAGTKTQTRRAVTAPAGAVVTSKSPAGLPIASQPGRGAWVLSCPYGVPGDRLWVREAWRVTSRHNATRPGALPPRRMTVFYDAGGSSANQADGRWGHDPDYPRGDGGLADAIRQAAKQRPGMFMPRWASRITLELADVRVERLQDISEADARAEGIDDETIDRVLHMAEAMNQREPRPAAWAYRTIWEDINGAGSWDANPWVWALSFRRLEP